MSTNIWSSLVSTLTSTLSATGASASTVGSAVSSAISSVIGNKFSTLVTILNNLAALGPAADAGELNALINQLETQLAQTASVPQAEFAFVSALKALVGKTDPASAVQWTQTAETAVTLLNNASSSILGNL